MIFLSNDCINLVAKVTPNKTLAKRPFPSAIASSAISPKTMWLDNNDENERTMNYDTDVLLTTVFMCCINLYQVLNKEGFQVKSPSMQNTTSQIATQQTSNALAFLHTRLTLQKKRKT